MKRTLVQKLGLLGLVSFFSYAAAVIFAPLAYPGYDWMAQAVSDLSAADAPSLALWNQLSAGYNACEVVCATVVCIGIQGRNPKLLRSGSPVVLFRMNSLTVPSAGSPESVSTTELPGESVCTAVAVSRPSVS